MGLVFTDPEDVEKIFLTGLSSSTTKEPLCTYFNCFGELVDCVVMKNNETDKSRRFGFVKFKDDQYLSSDSHGVYYSVVKTKHIKPAISLDSCPQN